MIAVCKFYDYFFNTTVPWTMKKIVFLEIFLIDLNIELDFVCNFKSYESNDFVTGGQADKLSNFE